MPNDVDDLKALADSIVANAGHLAGVIFPYDEAGVRILRMRLCEMAQDLAQMAEAFERMGKRSSREGSMCSPDDGRSIS